MSEGIGKGRLFSGICLLALAAALAFLAWELRQTRLSVGRRIEGLQDDYDRAAAALARKEQQLVEAGAKARETVTKADELTEKAKSAYQKARDMTGKARDQVDPPPPPPAEP